MLDNENENKKQSPKSLKETISLWQNFKKDKQKKEPSAIKTSMKKYKLIFEFKIKTFGTFLRDHWHLLIKSAAQNHLRIQACKKIKSGDACNLEFGSFTELKRYQKKVRLFTYSFSSTAFSILIAIVAVQMFFGTGKSQGATYGWKQLGWDGAVSTTLTNNHSNNQSNPEGWTGTYFKDADVDTSGSEAKIALATPAPWTETLNADFSPGAKSNTAVASNAVKLLKPVGATCAISADCGGNFCGSAASVCLDACSNITATTCGQSCAFLGDAYVTVSIGPANDKQCWFAENLRRTDVANFCGYGVTLPFECGSPRGRLYSWSTVMNGSASSTGAKIQGICPTGWHIPSRNATDNDFQKLSDLLGGNSVAGGKMKRTEAPTWWNSPNVGADNSSGFSAVSAGIATASGVLYGSGPSAFFWTSSEYDAGKAYIGYLVNDSAVLNPNSLYLKTNSTPTRCVLN